MSDLSLVSARRQPPNTLSDTFSDKLWQELTRTANIAYQAGDTRSAATGYQRALGEAERLLAAAERDAGPPDAAVSLVISHHNMAEMALDAGQPDLAMQHYQAPFDRLLSVARLSSAPTALRQSCAANLKEATIALATHLQKCGAPISVISDTIKKAQFVAGTMSQHSARRRTKALRPS